MERGNSFTFSVTNGVRQGGVLSPILFNVYFDELLQRLQDHDIGCHVGTKFVAALGYADNLTLLSPSLLGLQKAADICNDFAQEYSVKFDSKKTQCLCVEKDGEFFHLDGEKFKWVNCVRHLGNLITWNLKDDDDIQLKRGYFYRSVNNLCAKFKGILNNPDVASKRFMHIVVLFMVPSSGTVLVNHLMIYVLRARKLPGGFLIYRIVHIHVDICCHMLLVVNIYEITWSIDWRISLIL